MKTIDSTTLTELNNKVNFPIQLVSFEISTNNVQNLYLNTGYKDITYNGNVYSPGATVLGFSPVEETTDVKTNSVNIDFNGVPNTIIAALESVQPIGGKVTIYQAFWNETTQNIEGQIYQKWKGIISSFSTTEENQLDGFVKISVECKNIVGAILNTKSGRFTSKSSFQQFDSADLSMEFVASLVDFNPAFGKEE